MTANINPETGIRYGTIYLNSINQDVAHDLFYEGENLSEKEALEELREEIAATMRAEEEDGECEVRDVDDFNDELDRRVERACDMTLSDIEEPTIEGECDGVKYMISWLGGAPLLWIFESPVIVKARLCSPCVPNAGDLDSLDDDGYECYGIPEEWMDRDEPDDSMDGDHASALASAGFGTDEDYGA